MTTGGLGSSLRRAAPWLGLALLVWQALGVALLIDPSRPEGARLAYSFWVSGDAASRGLDPYAAYPGIPRMPVGDREVVEINLNPPALLPLFELAAGIDPWTLARGLVLGSAALYAAAVAWLARGRGLPVQAGWALACQPALSTLYFAQIYVATFLLAAAAWVFLDRGRPWLAGVALGLLAAAKPNFGLALLVLLAAGHWRAAVPAMAVAAGASLLPVALYGPEVYAQWRAAVAQDNHGLMFADASLYGALARYGWPATGAVAGAVAATAALALARGRRLGARDALALGLGASILCSPLAWMNYLIVLVPALVTRRWSRAEAVAAAVLLVPAGPLLLLGGAASALAPWLLGLYAMTTALLVARHAGAAPDRRRALPA